VTDFAEERKTSEPVELGIDEVRILVEEGREQGYLNTDHIADALQDDLNTPEAIAALHALEEEIRAAPPGLVKERLAGQLFNSFSLLGLEGIADFEERLLASEKARLAIDEAMVRERIEARLAARKAKNWAEADRIRDELAAMGIALKDAKNPATGEIETTWEIAR